MRVEIVSWSSQVSSSIAALIEDPDWVVEATKGQAEEPRIWVSSDVSHEDIRSICRQLRPLDLSVRWRDDSDSSEEDVLIEIPHPRSENTESTGMENWSLTVEAEHEERAAALVSELWGAGFRADAATCKTSCNLLGVIQIGDDRAENHYLAQCLGLYCRSALGLEFLLEVSNHQDRDDIRVCVPTEMTDLSLVASLIDVEIRYDDVAQGRVLAERIRVSGFCRIHEETLPPDDVLEKKIRIVEGVLSNPRLSELRGRMVECVSNVAQELGVDLEYYPIVLSGPHKSEPFELSDHAADVGGRVLIDFPAIAMARQDRQPYSPFKASSYSVSLISDSIFAIEELRSRLREEGFRVDGTHVRDRAGGEDRVPGFWIAMERAAKHQGVREAVRNVVEERMREDGVPNEFPLRTNVQITDDKSAIIIEYPINEVKSGQLHERASDPKYFDLRIESPHPKSVESLFESLKSWGFNEAKNDIGDGTTVPKIEYGGAPERLVRNISEHFHEQMGRCCQLHKKWDQGDNDIWIRMPECEALGEDQQAGSSRSQAGGGVEASGMHFSGDSEEVIAGLHEASVPVFSECGDGRDGPGRSRPSAPDLVSPPASPGSTPSSGSRRATRTGG